MVNFVWTKYSQIFPPHGNPPYLNMLVGGNTGGNPSLMMFRTAQEADILSTVLEIRNLFPVEGRPIGDAKLPHRFRELYGVDSMSMQWYEPDPRTFRGKFYYNTRLNKLYMKITSPYRPFWKQINL